MESLVEEYLDEANMGAPEIACFGVAGPVRQGRVKATNLAWELTEDTLLQAIGARSVKIVNDMLRDGMFVHPLWAEALNSLFGALED